MKEITNHFVIRQEAVMIDDTCRGYNNTKMVLGSATQIEDFDYILNGQPQDIDLYVQHVKPGCGLDCSVEKPAFVVNTDRVYWSDPVELSKDTNRVTFNVLSKDKVSFGLGQTEKCKKSAENLNGCFEVAISQDMICLLPNTDFSEEEAKMWCVSTGSTGYIDNTISLEWSIVQHSAEIHYLFVELYEHASQGRVTGQWALESRKFERRETDFKFANFNAKGTEATFSVWFNQGESSAPSWVQDLRVAKEKNNFRASIATSQEDLAGTS